MVLPWHEGSRRSFTHSSEMIAQIVIEDIESSPETSFLVKRGPGLSLASNGVRILIEESNRDQTRIKHLALSTAKKIRDCWVEDPCTDSFVIPEQPSSLLEYILSEEASQSIAENKIHRLLQEQGSQWLTRPPSWETLEFCATMTHAGHIIPPRDVGPGLDNMIWHVFGYKLLIVWEGSVKNYETIRRRNVYYHDMDLGWCLENLFGLKLSFLVHTYDKPNRGRVVIPGGSILYSISFTPCMHLSASYFLPSSFDTAMLKTKMLEDDLRSNTAWWYPSDWVQARILTHMSRDWWARYLIRNRHDVEVQTLGSVLEALGAAPPWEIFPDPYIYLLPPSCFPYI